MVVSEITASAVVVIYEPVWNNDCKLPFSGLCEDAAPLDTGAGGDRGKGRPFDYLGAHQNPCPCSGSPEHPRINSIEITFTSAVVGYLRGWPSLRLGLNDQLGSWLECPAARKEAGKRRITWPKTNSGNSYWLLTSTMWLDFNSFCDSLQRHLPICTWTWPLWLFQKRPVYKLEFLTNELDFFFESRHHPFFKKEPKKRALDFA